jgi:hypothetical protein
MRVIKNKRIQSSIQHEDRTVISGNTWSNLTTPTQPNISIRVNFLYIFMFEVSTHEKLYWKQRKLYSSYPVTNEKYLAIRFATLHSYPCSFPLHGSHIFLWSSIFVHFDILESSRLSFCFTSHVVRKKCFPLVEDCILRIYILLPEVLTRKQRKMKDHHKFKNFL